MEATHTYTYTHADARTHMCVCIYIYIYILGPPEVPFCPLLGQGFPTKIDYRQKGHPYSSLSNLEDQVYAQEYTHTDMQTPSSPAQASAALGAGLVPKRAARLHAAAELLADGRPFFGRSREVRWMLPFG